MTTYPRKPGKYGHINLNIISPNFSMILRKLIRENNPWNSRFLPSLILLVSLLVTAWAAHLTKQYVENSSRQFFEIEVDELSQAITARLENYHYLMLGLTGLFAASDQISHIEWQAYLRNIKLNSSYPGLVGIGFVKHIAAADLETHTAGMRRDGFANYAIHPSGLREQYSSIVFPMPPHGDKHSTLGFDMLTQPQQRRAMEFARSRGLSASTGKMEFSNGIDDNKEVGFLTFFPIYEDDTPQINEEKRRSLLIGYVYNRIHMKDLMDDIFRLRKPEIKIQIYEGADSTPQLLLYNSNNAVERNGEILTPAFKSERALTVNNRTWTIQFSSPPYAEVVKERYLYQIILAGGALISFLFFVVAWTLSISRKRAIAIAEQMTAELRAMALKTSHLAQHDFLTDLPNRVLLDDRLTQAIGNAARYKRRIALLFIDLDRFKHVNDSLGHAAGDQLLQQVANRLSAQLRAADTLSRQGGDEFIVLLSELRSAEEAAVVAQKLLVAGSQPYHLGEHELNISLSIGISIFPEDGDESSALIKHADTAMYHAKNMGRNNYQFFTGSIGKLADERLVIENDLRHAIKNEELRVYYQPQLDFESGRIVGAEALVRWQKTATEIIYPAAFIPIAEESRLIIEIDKWVLAQACRQVRAWQSSGLAIVPVSVNLSMANFNEPDFFAYVESVLHETELNPRYLEIELTETILMKNVDVVKATLLRLKSIGISIAIDDFGTGYSSLSYLAQFPIDTLKVDRSFVQNITSDIKNAAITQAIISMAKSVSERVVAEGVETLEQAKMLQANQCFVMQGYLFSKPVPAEAFESMLRDCVSTNLTSPHEISIE